MVHDIFITAVSSIRKRQPHHYNLSLFVSLFDGNYFLLFMKYETRLLYLIYALRSVIIKTNLIIEIYSVCSILQAVEI